MTKAAIAAPAHEILLKLGVDCQERTKDLYIVEAPHACSKLIGAAYDAGVRVLNLTKVVDLVVRGKTPAVEGAVVNWWPVEAAGHDIVHVDPIALETNAVVDATGHDAVALRYLSKRGLFQDVPGNGAMWVAESEEQVMRKTGEVFPNLFVVGLAVAAVYGTPRMGPAFGSMLLSGRKGADLIKKRLLKK
jgi:thiamine thiazole synthase